MFDPASSSVLPCTPPPSSPPPPSTYSQWIGGTINSTLSSITQVHTLTHNPAPSSVPSPPLPPLSPQRFSSIATVSGLAGQVVGKAPQHSVQPKVMDAVSKSRDSCLALT